jgi:hypothetical protein
MWAIYTKILAVSTTILNFRQNNAVFQQNIWLILYFSPNLVLLAPTLMSCPRRRASTDRKENGFLLSQE